MKRNNSAELICSREEDVHEITYEPAYVATIISFFFILYLLVFFAIKSALPIVMDSMTNIIIISAILGFLVTSVLFYSSVKEFV